ncbi:recombinase family protein [Rubellimicrobium rubrum]|uniref:Recombinase family protein n=1 Tax=Rubellimicrobium rubrum TaxID=2585369 RepID=A0A5C4MNW0_9RHOB|nr:recombinase family protein [Rubellimicrobium rubrum]TNC47495.1 recombinase family protein [Rubellimicrobium rubrum]
METPSRKARRAAAAIQRQAKTPSKPQAVLYTRFSSTKQNELSAEDQLALNRNTAERQDFDVAGELKDCALSGRTHLRSPPGISALKAFVDANDVQVLVVESVDRLGRRAADIANLASWFESRGVELWASNGGRIDWKLVPSLGAVAELQSRETGDKTRRGGASATKNGRVAAGVAYGYCVIHGLKGEVNRAVVPEEARVVRRIFSDYAAGMSARSIADALNSEGIPSPKGGTWNDSTIRGNAKKRDGMLCNEAYVGLIVYGRNELHRDPDTGNRLSRPGSAEDIVTGERPELQIADDATWNEVQDRLEATREHFVGQEKDPTTNPLNTVHRAKYLVARLLTCGCCGGGYTIVGKDRYGCFTHRSKGASVCKNGKTVSRFRIEERVLRHVRRGLITPGLAEAFATEATRLLAAHKAEAQTQISNLAPNLAKVERRIKSLLDQIEDDPRPSLLDRLGKRETERDELRAHIASQAATRPRPMAHTPEDLRAIYADQVRRLDTLLAGPGHVIEANELLRHLIARVVLPPDPEAPDGLAVELQGDLS